MTRTYIDFHLLQTVPPSCINRDDTGSPKTAIYGGVRRTRVSSQAWKRATRKQFGDVVDGVGLVGVRTKRVVELVATRLSDEGMDEAGAQELAAVAVAAAGLKLTKARKNERQETEFLVLVSAQQAGALAELASAAFQEAGGDVAKAVKALSSAESKREAKRALGQGNSLDLALFGRMVANDTDLNVDASCQVAHAISVHAADTEFDYFTAVDDLKGEGEDAGAGMIGTVEFASATLYRYASINAGALAENLGDDRLTQRGIEAFASAFVRSMPTGKVNTFANHTLPEVIVVTIRQDQPVSFVGAFERPVVPGAEGGHADAAAQRLASWAESTARDYGIDPVAGWVVGIGELGGLVEGLGQRVSFAELPAAVAEAAVARLAERP